MDSETINLCGQIMAIGVGCGFGLFSLFSLLSYAIRELFKLFKM